MCMLLCEGNVEISHSVARALRSYGIGDIQIADSPASASHLIERHAVSVAVVDFAAFDDAEAAELVRSLTERDAEVILYSDRQPDPAVFAGLHYIFVDKSVHADDLAGVAAVQRRLALRRLKHQA